MRRLSRYRKVNFSFVTAPGNFKDNFRTNPLGFVLRKVEVIVQDMPHDFLVRHEFGDFDGAAVNVFLERRALAFTTRIR
jgi:hypothetical protein